jgi:transposase-like protein
MYKKYDCFDCGDTMIWEQDSLVCNSCSRTWTPEINYRSNYSNVSSHKSEFYHDEWSPKDIDRIQKENGLSDQDISNGAWIDF